ncbi:MAG: hypothetical protein V7637_4348 [Mycobacteriales bacterium]
MTAYYLFRTSRTDRASSQRPPLAEHSIDSYLLLQANLRYLLNQWDPLGVADLVDDEYDCLLVPLWNILTGNSTPSQVSELLWYELEDHFRLDPARHGVDSMANRLVAWAAAARPT